MAIGQMTTGLYHTKAGSTVRISGKHSGISEVSFDWLEEPHACSDCVPEAYPVDDALVWHCEVCGGGSAELMEVK